MKIYVAINDGDWLDRHDHRRYVTNTDWWHNPSARTFRKASAGDLFLIKRKYPEDKLVVSARLKSDYRVMAAEKAWRYASEAYTEDSSWRQRAARTLRIPEGQVTRESKIALISLEDLFWFPVEQQPRAPVISKFVETGQLYKASAPEYEGLKSLPPSRSVANAINQPMRNSYVRATEAQLAEILPLHTDMARRFEKWLKDGGYSDVRPEEAWVDVQFTRDNHTFMAELKICYDDNTRQAIRDAVGQVFEYNHYPDRTPAAEWWIVLNRKPSQNDIKYIEKLRKRHLAPLHLGYEINSGIGKFCILK